MCLCVCVCACVCQVLFFCCDHSTLHAVYVSGWCCRRHWRRCRLLVPIASVHSNSAYVLQYNRTYIPQCTTNQIPLLPRLVNLFCFALRFSFACAECQSNVHMSRTWHFNYHRRLYCLFISIRSDRWRWIILELCVWSGVFSMMC